MKTALEQTALLDRVHAAMLAGAIGDAMGGPVEGWSYERIAAVHGVVDRPLPYIHQPDYHNQFGNAAGTVTDDTRLKHLVAEAIIHADGRPRRGDLVWAILGAYQDAETPLARGFLEEYALGGVYGEDKLIWGGRMTNGFLMANAPVGLLCACDPQAAFALSYQLDFISDGYAKYSAAMGAATVAAALRPGANPDTVVEATLSAAKPHRIEGPLTRSWQWYGEVFHLNERLISRAVELAHRHQDVLALRADYYRELQVSSLGSEAAQTLAVALGMLVATDGDLRNTIIGCVNYGRDNDSYASVAGGIAGALNGLAAVPPDWRTIVERANPEMDIRGLAQGLVRAIAARYEHQRGVVRDVDALLQS
jgi:ADP-ribosylglycohydrolase